MNYVIFSTFKYRFYTPIFMFKENIYFLSNFIIIILTILSISSFKNKSRKTYFIISINIILEVLYNIFLFIVVSPFMIFSIKLLEFIFILHLNEEIYTNKKSANLLVPLIIWNFILTLLSTLILFLNS